MTINIGDKAPNFSLPGSGGETYSLAADSAAWTVLYFYPKDDTPGCTTEAKDFTALAEKFTAANCTVIGVSKDTVAKHDKFIAKHQLGIKLVSDETGELTEKYGVWVEKNLYGRKYMGIERATFLIDANSIVQKIWRKVRVKDHASLVLEAATALQAS